MHSEGMGKAAEVGIPLIGLDAVQAAIGGMYDSLKPDLTIHDFAIMILEDTNAIIHHAHWIEQATWRRWAQADDRYARLVQAAGYAIMELIALLDKLDVSALAVLHGAIADQIAIGHPLSLVESEERHRAEVVREAATRMFENWQREQEGKDAHEGSGGQAPANQGGTI